MGAQGVFPRNLGVSFAWAKRSAISGEEGEITKKLASLATLATLPHHTEVQMDPVIRPPLLLANRDSLPLVASTPR